MMPATAELVHRQRKVLFAAYRYLNANPNRLGFDLPDLKAQLNPAIPNGILSPTLSDLVRAGLLTVDFGHYGEVEHRLTGFGLKVAEELEQLAGGSEAEMTVPASDRFVTRSDNEAAFSEAQQRLTALAEALRGANDVFADAAERLAVVREVEGIRDLLSQAKVRAAAIWAAITGNGVVRWLVDRAAGGLVATAAVAAAAALARIVGLPLPW